MFAQAVKAAETELTDQQKTVLQMLQRGQPLLNKESLGLNPEDNE